MIQMEIYGKPIPLNRARACHRGSFIQMYDSQTKEKEGYKWQIRAVFNNKPITVPVEIVCIFYFGIPKGTSKARTREMLANTMVPMKRPDLDNLIKFILDCMNGIVYQDDAQVVRIIAEKRYGDKPKTLIQVVPRLHTDGDK